MSHCSLVPIALPLLFIKAHSLESCLIRSNDPLALVSRVDMFVKSYGRSGLTRSHQGHITRPHLLVQAQAPRGYRLLSLTLHVCTRVLAFCYGFPGLLEHGCARRSVQAVVASTSLPKHPFSIGASGTAISFSKLSSMSQCLWLR